MTDAQFAALAQLLRLRPGPAQDAARLVMTQSMSTPDAARQVGMSYVAAHRAVKRAKDGLDLAKTAAAQFAALAQLLRLRPGPAQDAARLVMAQGLPTADAARSVGMDYRAATYAVKRVRAGLDLVKIAAGG